MVFDEQIAKCIGYWFLEASSWSACAPFLLYQASAFQQRKLSNHPSLSTHDKLANNIYPNSTLPNHFLQATFHPVHHTYAPQSFKSTLKHGIPSSPTYMANVKEAQEQIRQPQSRRSPRSPCPTRPSHYWQERPFDHATFPGRQ